MVLAGLDWSAAIMEDFDRFLARRKRPALGSSNTANAAGAAANGPVLFTYAEVRDITSRALVEQEERLRLEFQAALRDRLNGKPRTPACPPRNRAGPRNRACAYLFPRLLTQRSLRACSQSNTKTFPGSTRTTWRGSCASHITTT